MPIHEQEQELEKIYESPADERTRIWNEILKNKASSDGSTYDKQIRNFLNGDELGLVITLTEYRDLVGKAAGREVEIKYLKERIDELNARNLELNDALNDMHIRITELRKENRELKEDKEENGTD
jgi:hypothetical protein